MTQVNIACELFAAIITFVLLMCCIFETSDADGKKTTSALYTAMLSVNLAVLACDLVTYIYAGVKELTALLYFCNFMVYSLGYVLTALFTWYLVAYISEKEQISFRTVYIIGSLCTVAVVLVVISLFNHMYFRFENGVYMRGNMYWLSQLYPISILIFDMLFIFKHKHILGFHDTFALLTYGIMPVIAMIIQIISYGVVLLYTATTLSLLIIYVTIHADQRRRLAQSEKELTQANIAIMLSQIQPHFLYNSLTAISRLCEKDPEQARKAIIDFSLFLRRNLESLKHIEPVPFENELKHVEIYLALEKMRFGDELKIFYDIQAVNFMIPSLSVQPLVENAVKHGVGNKDGGGTISICTKETENNYEVVVTDDGIGFDPSENRYDGRTHIGIDNVRSRISAQCGGTLEIYSRKGEGAKMTIKIPKGDAKI